MTAARSFSQGLLAWYDAHARRLPWRMPPEGSKAGGRPDPYRVWLSEIMLQQTTVAAVKAYFERFVNRWPSVEDLADAPVEAVMGEWAGLGYYARARNLHACAKEVAHRHGGRFPETAEALRALPGIGEYTSAAIAAIAFGEAVAVVDGNVERVVTRRLAIDTPVLKARPRIRAEVAALTAADRPGDFAQAMMDLGATICTPRSPACILCPVREGCVAGATGTAERYPMKAPKPAKPSRQGAAFVAVRPADGAVWLSRRPDEGMLGGMCGPPTTDWSARADGATGASSAPFPAEWRAAGSVAHGFTHFDLTLEVWRADLDGLPAGDGWWSSPNAITMEALPTLMKKAIATGLGEQPAAVQKRPRRKGGS